MRLCLGKSTEVRLEAMDKVQVEVKIEVVSTVREWR